jgi:hypothetical protein
MIDQTRLDALDPLDRANFDAKPVVRWRVTWPDGTTEIVEAHFAQMRGDDVMAFHFDYLGAHRVVNLQHVRDVEQLPD